MYRFILFIIVAYAFAGCSIDPELRGGQQSIESNKLLEIKAGPAIHINQTRNIIDTDTFPENTVIGIFVSGGSYKREVSYYTYKGQKWQYPNVSRIYLNEDTATVYGFYPSNATLLPLTKDSLHKVQIRIQKSDTTFTDINQLDYMYATGAYDEANNNYPEFKICYKDKEINVANLYFHHALSQVSFIINKSKDYKGTGKLTQLELKTVKTNPFYIGKGTMDVSSGKILLSDTCTCLTFSGHTSINAYANPTSQEISVSRLLPPMDNLNNIILSLTIDGTQIEVALPVNLVSKWEKEKKYVYTLCLDNSNLTFDNFILDDWINQTVSPIVITM